MSDCSDRLPSYERVLFPAAALELCLVQVKFPPLARFGESGYLSALKEELGEEYPLASTEQAMNIVVTPQGVTSAPGGELLRFTSIDSTWSVVLTHESVSLETRHYSNIDEFAARFGTILQQVETHLHPRYQLRFGLRYVNEFRHPRGDNYDGWRTLLNPDLLMGPHDVIGGTVEQTIGELRTRRADGILLLRHGFLTGTTVVPMGRTPPKTGPFYLLDLDYYDETATEFDPAPEQRMRTYNDFLYQVFRWCIGDGELYRVLGEQP